MNERPEYEGVLSRIFATGATAKIMDFFLDHKEYDHSISEIVAATGLSFRTVSKEIPRLQNLGFIVNRRKVVNANMYKLDEKSQAIDLLEKFSLLASQIASLYKPVDQAEAFHGGEQTILEGSEMRP